MRHMRGKPKNDISYSVRADRSVCFSAFSSQGRHNRRHCFRCVQPMTPSVTGYFCCPLSAAIPSTAVNPVVFHVEETRLFSSHFQHSLSDVSTFADRSSRPGRAIRLVCVCLCVNNLDQMTFRHVVSSSHYPD